MLRKIVTVRKRSLGLVNLDLEKHVLKKLNLKLILVLAGIFVLL